MPSASLGRQNPLPDIRAAADAHAFIAVDETTVSPEEARYMGWGKVSGIYPYLMQDGYNRRRRNRAWKGAVLENRYLRAVFLPELGGRLWSLTDLTTGRELLHCNPVFQPCNLALRNAWISGGVEWNIGIIGHTPFTVDRVFAEKLALADGTPVLRMYQYERIRQLIYRVEAMLPEDSRQLYVRVRIDNARKTDTAVYWWSNMAVNEGEDVRVIVPADRSFIYGYGKKLSKAPIPYRDMEGTDGVSRPVDISHTTQLPHAMDFFFDIEKGRRRFISAVGGDGYGFVQTSTDRLIGRKLFVWGMNPGGRNWQTYLSKPGSAYIELQAGLARTQLEHLPMEGGAVIDWMEAYGPIQTDPALTQGRDWAAAVAETERALAAACPREKVEEMLERARRELDGAQGELVFRGESWAGVQLALLGKEAFSAAGLRFPRSRVKEREGIWLSLIEKGELPCPEPLAEPRSYQIGPEWEALLEKSIENGGGHWFSYYHLGVMQAQRGALAEADASLEKSAACAESPWALRCRGAVASLQKEDAKAAEYLLRAVRLLPEPHLCREALEALQRAGRFEEMVTVYASLPEKIRALGRIKALYAGALVETDRLAEAEKLLGGAFRLTDVREGEVRLTDLWFRLCAKKRAAQEGVPLTDALMEEVRKTAPVPSHLDFRMR